MYNIKKIFRKKLNFLLIIILSILFLCLIFLFKYIFLVQENIEKQIYDRYKNRELIVYGPKDKVKEKINNINDVLFVYSDYQMLSIESDDIGIFNINAYFTEDMPTLLIGSYPQNEGEIILPRNIYRESGIVDLSDYCGKEIDFLLNNEYNLKMYVAGIYENDNDFSAYYNLNYIENLIDKTHNNSTDNTRVLINHYKNKDNVINKLGFKASLYDIGGLDEINMYQSLFNLIILLVGITIIFIVIIFFVVASILYHETRDDRFIQFALGYSNNLMALNYVHYYLEMTLFSLFLSFIGYFVGIFMFNYFITSENIVLNDLFSVTFNCKFLLPVIFIIIVILLLLYLFISFRLLKSNDMET